MINNTLGSVSKNKNLFVILSTLVLFLSIPITVFVALNVRDNRSRAEGLTIPRVESGVVKLNLKYSPKNEKLTLDKKDKISRLPKKENPKTSKKNAKVIAFNVEQRNEFDKPIYNFVYELEVSVNNKGEFQKSSVDFSIELPERLGKVVISQGEKKLLEESL